MSDMIEAKKCITPIGIASYPAVFTPKGFDGKEPVYSLTIIFDKKTDLKPIKRAIKAAIVEKYGTDSSKIPKRFKLPIRDGAEFEGKEGYGDHVVFIRASSKNAPGIVDARNVRMTSEADFYPGCKCRAQLIAFVYDQQGNKGVSFSLLNVQKCGEGEPISGRKPAEEVFDAIELPDDEDDDDFGLDDEDDDDDFDFG